MTETIGMSYKGLSSDHRHGEIKSFSKEAIAAINASLLKGHDPEAAKRAASAKTLSNKYEYQEKKRMNW